jgi:hypothetical protein
MNEVAEWLQLLLCIWKVLGSISGQTGYADNIFHRYPQSIADHSAVQSKAWTVFTHLNIEIVGSYPTQGMDVCLFCACVRYWPCDGLITRPRSPTNCLRLRLPYASSGTYQPTYLAQSIEEYVKIVPQIRLQLLPSTSFPIHYSLIILSFDTR